jgi:hypothetical protein
MFLFTTPARIGETGARPAGLPPARQPEVLDAIRDGSQRSGTGFDYLVATATRESSLNPAAKAQTSTASGLFQFIEQTWLGTLKSSGPAHGLGDYAAAIDKTKGGRFEVQDAEMKAQILQMRHDPTVAAIMAGELTRQNATMLGATLGRSPTQGELYAAHVMGAAGASDLILQAQAQPDARAAERYPEQAKANRGIFFEAGRARSLAEVYQVLTGRSGAQAVAVPAVPAVSSDPSSWFMRESKLQTMPMAYAQADGPAMHALFRTEGKRGPVNHTVERLWSSPKRGGDEPGPTFYPRSSRDMPTKAQATASINAPAMGAVLAQPAPQPLPLSVPLPVPRPLFFVSPDVAPRRQPGAGQPLELRLFAKAGTRA